MAKTEFEELKTLITRYGRELNQFILEVQETLNGINDKFTTISKSLKSCQSHCHVASEQNLMSKGTPT